MKKRRLFGIFTICVILFLCSLVTFAAQDYPSRPITMVVPWSTGGNTDITARALQVPLQNALGVPVVVNNMPGGSALVGSEYVLNAKPDGYTVLFGSDSPGHWRVLGLSPDLSFADFNTLMIFTVPFSTVCVHADSKWQTMEELLEDIKNNPGEITLGYAGLGASAHTMYLILEKFAGIKMKLVPYKGGGPTIIGALNREVDVCFQMLSEVIDYVEAGDFRLLATFTEKRVPDFPDVPSVGEFVPEAQPFIKGASITGLFTSKDTPKEINEVLTNAAKEAIKDPRWEKTIKSLYVQTPYLSGEEAETFVKNWGNFKSWLFYDAGIAKSSPEEFGITKPY
ncbi:MAG: tripartite tricarboxylate transporter substrate binding protein [Candidatus Caldatribacteriota bacterium]